MLKVKKVNVSELSLGMYVSELDRPWLGTPFLLQGFCIESEDEIETLRDLCTHVFVDFAQSDLARSRSNRANRANRAIKAGPAPKRSTRSDLRQNRPQKEYKDTVTTKGELQAARQAIEGLSSSIRALFQNGIRGTAIDVEEIRRSVEPMVDSICRNPDACIWLARLRDQDDYTYQHSVACSVWAVALGRQLRFIEGDLNSLAVGGLLFDVGKLRIDKELLNRESELSEEDHQLLQDHVMLGETTLARQNLSPDILDMVRFHHERHDGSGYPFGLSQNEIPVFGRIAGVVDAFDAMTSHRAYAKGMSPSQAIRVLNQDRDRGFQAAIVDEFIQAIGIYPAGTLVELSTGEVGVVIAEGRIRRLRPKLMVILNADKEPLRTPVTLNLGDVRSDPSGQPLNIVTSLESDAYGINIAALEI